MMPVFRFSKCISLDMIGEKRMMKYALQMQSYRDAANEKKKERI